MDGGPGGAGRVAVPATGTVDTAKGYPKGAGPCPVLEPGAMLGAFEGHVISRNLQVVLTSAKWMSHQIPLGQRLMASCPSELFFAPLQADPFIYSPP